MTTKPKDYDYFNNKILRSTKDLCELVEFAGYRGTQLQYDNGAFLSSLSDFLDDNPSVLEMIQRHIFDNDQDRDGNSLSEVLKVTKVPNCFISTLELTEENLPIHFSKDQFLDFLSDNFDDSPAYHGGFDGPSDLDTAIAFAKGKGFEIEVKQ